MNRVDWVGIVRISLWFGVVLLFLVGGIVARCRGMDLGVKHPDGTEPTCDLPLSLRTKNVGGSDGSGLCVFTSIGHAARYQNEPRLKDFQARMRSELGGGYPSKVDRMIAKYAPGVNYLQYEGRDPTIIEVALNSGRMASVTYAGRDPNYGNARIAHMVNPIFLDNQRACILDNNFITDDRIVWMTRAEFIERWIAMGDGRRGGWIVVLLTPAPPPVPWN